MDSVKQICTYRDLSFSLHRYLLRLFLDFLLHFLVTSQFLKNKMQRQVPEEKRHLVERAFAGAQSPGPEIGTKNRKAGAPLDLVPLAC